MSENMERLKINLKINIISASCAGLIWLILFMFYIGSTRDFDSAWKIVYPIGLVWCGGVGRISYNAKYKRNVVVFAWIQVIGYFLNSFFYGLGVEQVFEDTYRITSLLLMFENFVSLVVFSCCEKNKGEFESKVE